MGRILKCPAVRIQSSRSRIGNFTSLRQEGGMALEFAPPLIIQKEEIDEAIPVLDSCITEEEKAMGLSK